MTYQGEKLVRDKIPEILMRKGDTVTVRKSRDGDEFKVLLRKKLLEEAQEYADKPDDPAEWNDVLDVLNALARAYGINEETTRAGDQKRDERGTFDRQLVLISTVERQPLPGELVQMPGSHPTEVETCVGDRVVKLRSRDTLARVRLGVEGDWQYQGDYYESPAT